MSASPTIQESAYGSAIEEDNPSAQPPASDEVPPRPTDFSPFFMLIEDPETGEHFHPHVHYMFADDDEDIVTNLALEALAQQEADTTPHETAKERFALIDLAADGKTVRSAVSLSDDWQTLKASVEEAPSWSNGTDNGSKGVMLKLRGQGTTSKAVKPQASVADLEGLMRTFDNQLNALEEAMKENDLVPDAAASAQVGSKPPANVTNVVQDEIDGTG